MDFYTQISKYYDYIFPAGQEQLAFLEKAAPTDKTKARILDVACGSGEYSVALAAKGYDVTATDIDDKMVAAALNKVARAGVLLSVIKCDMLELSGCISGGFGLLYCIGNSLVHLGSKNEILKALHEMWNLLDSGGVIALQIINYDRVFKHSISSLPTLENDDIGMLFERKYELDASSGLINFNTVLTVKNNTTTPEKEIYANSIPLLPLKSGELRQLLADAGFENIIFSGDFSGNEYNDESYLLVALASKK